MQEISLDGIRIYTSINKKQTKKREIDFVQQWKSSTC